MNSRSLRQEELDGYHRNNFVNTILDYINTSGEARFIVHGDNYSLVNIKKVSRGEWDISVAGSHRYTYRMSHLIDFVEKIYDRRDEIIALNNEIEISAYYTTANDDAEPDSI